MQSFFTDPLTPHVFWLMAQPLLGCDRSSPDWYRLVGMACDTIIGLDTEAEKFPRKMTIVPLSRRFWEVIQIKNSFTAPLYLYAKEIPKITTQSELVLLAKQVLIEWPLLSKSSLVYDEAKFDLCTFQDVNYTFARTEFFDCCVFHRRMRDLFWEQLGREYILATSCKVESPDLTGNDWEGSVLDYVLTDGTTLGDCII